MTHTFIKKGLRGFTLIELLVVIAIIGLLSTVIAAPIQNARKKAKDAKKVAEIKAIELALDQYAEANGGNYPAALSSLTPVYMPVLPVWASSSASVAVRDRLAYTQYTAHSNTSSYPDVAFGYHMGIHLDNYNQALDSDRDCYGGTVGTTLPVGSCVYYNGVSGDTIVGAGTNYSGGITLGTPTTTGWSGTNNDFSGADTGTSTCTGNNDCIFDISNQQ